MADAKAKAKATLNRELGLPPEAILLLKSMGIEIPGTVKEITTETVVDETTKRIILPKGMNKLEAAQELEKQWENEEQTIDHDIAFDEWQWKDVLIAIKKVTEETFGWMNAVASFFSNPTEIDIVVDIKNREKVTDKAYYGKFKISTWDNANANIGINKNGTVMLSITGKRKFASEITEYFKLIQNYLRDHSIYKGKSIVVTKHPQFGMDFELIENKPSDKVVLNEDEESVVNTFIIDALQDGVKRTYLFTGDYGNGKTEIAMRVGVEAVKHNISFFYLKDASMFDEVLNKLKQYSPAVLFVEDIDEIAGTQDRDAAMNKILNTLDGVQTKGHALTTIFTTNHVERINAALRRPGRIDLIVQFRNPNKTTVRKIYDMYFKKLNGYENLDMNALVERTPDCQGAVVAEIAKRVVKLHDRKGTITTEQAFACIVSMDYHIELMKEKPQETTKEKKLWQAMQSMTIGALVKHNGDDEEEDD